ncbi:MAG: menaquinone biosynthesis protein [Pirellulales bacterium]
MNKATKIRLGAVNYLNTRPLVYGLERRAPNIDLVFDLPSRLADGLAAGVFDVALIPSIELFQDPSYRTVSNVCIGCRGPVLSVKLFSHVAVDKIRTLYLDEGSRTSAALVQILLAERFGVRPLLRTLPINASVDSSLLAPGESDAVLLIGDRAIHSPPGRFAVVWDLGDEWLQWSGLPFVFAMWTARAGVELGDLDVALEQSRDDGLAHVDEIAHAEAAKLGLTMPQCRSYLLDNLNFEFGPRERRGLSLFYQKAASLGLAPLGVDLGYEDCEVAR